MKIPKLIFGICLFLILTAFTIELKSQTGDLDVCLSCIGGDGIAGAIISVGGIYIDTTGTSGCVYFTDIPVGSWSVTCEIEGYSILTSMVEIVEGMTTESNFEVYCPIFMVNPLNIEVVLEPNQQTTEIITLSNPGLESVSWSAELEIFPPANTDDFLDVQFQYPITGAAGHKGIECDGEYFWVTTLGNELYKYALDGTLIEIFPGFNFTDMAFNGTYFYGGTGSQTIYEVDLYTQTIVSTFTAPGNVRAIAYNHDENILYGYSWGGDIITFDPSGIMLGSAPLGPIGANYSGFAYDNVTDGGPYLWGYGLTGTDLNVLIQLQLPTMQETGFTVSLGSILPEPISNVSGGLFTHPIFDPELWTLGGVVTDEWIWGLELSEEEIWVSIEPTSGSLGPGESEEMEVTFDATGVMPWIYTGQIQFSTTPNVGSPVVDIAMDIEGYPPIPYNLEATINCVTVDLNWELSNWYYPPVSFNIYKSDTLIANVPDSFYSDSLVMPEVQYEYAVSAVYSVGETWPVPIDVIVPLPAGLEPTNIEANIINNNILCLSWTTNACLQPETYSLYKNNELLALLNIPEYCDTLFTPGYYEYYVTATYYFGEFGPSNTFYFLHTEAIETLQENKIKLYPNPAKDNLIVQSQEMIERIEIFNNIGTIITVKNANSKSYQFDISHFNPGIYYIKIETEQDMILRKFVVQ